MSGRKGGNGGKPRFPSVRSPAEAAAEWQPFSYIVVNLARQIRPNEIAFSGVNSTLPMLACLLAKRAYDFRYTYINVAGGVEPVPTTIPFSSSDPAIVAGSPAIFANPDFYDLCTRGGLDLVFLGCAQIDAEGRTNVSAIGSWENPKVRLPGRRRRGRHDADREARRHVAHRACDARAGGEARFRDGRGQHGDARHAARRVSARDDARQPLPPRVVESGRRHR